MFVIWKPCVGNSNSLTPTDRKTEGIHKRHPPSFDLSGNRGVKEFVDIHMTAYSNDSYDSEKLEKKLIKSRYFHDLLHAVGRSHQLKLSLIIKSFIHDKKHPKSCRRNI